MEDTEEQETYISKGDSLIEQSDFDGAIAVYSKAISEDPKDGFNFHLRGDAYRLKGDLERAVVEYSKALALYDNDEDRALTLMYRATAFIGKSEYHNVIADADAVIKTGFFLSEAYLARGKAHFMLGPINLGVEDLRKAADLGSKGALMELEKYGYPYTPVMKVKKK